jgi:hypothetical protein
MATAFNWAGRAGGSKIYNGLIIQSSLIDKRKTLNIELKLETFA